MITKTTLLFSALIASGCSYNVGYWPDCNDPDAARTFVLKCIGANRITSVAEDGDARAMPSACMEEFEKTCPKNFFVSASVDNPSLPRYGSIPCDLATNPAQIKACVKAGWVHGGRK